MQSVDLFANLSVGKKLLLGFAMVLLLTLGVAGTGFYAVDSILDRSHQMNQLSRINAAILEARGLERDFALTRSDESANALRSTLAKLDRELEELAEGSSEEHRQTLQQIRSDAAVYTDQFTQYGQLIGKGVALRERMAEAAQKSREEFEYIELDMYDAVRVLRLEGDHLKGSDPLTIAEAASGLTKRILDLRTFDSMFIANSAQAAVDSWNESYQDVTTIGSSLKTWLNDEQKATMDGALAALASYQQAFGEFRSNRAERVSLEQAMVAQAQRILDTADKALAGATEAMQDQRRSAYMLLGVISVLAVVIGLVAAMAISRMIVVPLRYTVQLAQRVAEGDLTQSQEVTRRDELGQLQKAMSEMTVSLRTLIGRIGGGVGQIATAAEQLSAVTAQTSAGVQKQRVETEQVATAMHEMAATVQEVAQNAEQASLAARQADEQARQGDVVVKEAIGQIDSLSGEVEHSAHAIEELNTESGRIGTVLEVIRAVAEQTNLLALNAAIEAARAGEQGRGFAVVADEVRALARRTHDSTEEIEGLIANLQRVAQKAVEQMQTSRNLTQRTVDLASEAGSALGRITESVSTIEQMNQQIAAAAEQQSAVAENISESVTRVRDIGEQSASGSEQTAAASAELARLGVELQGLVARFRT
ncbi:HAMP domain-containing methyl-accepting chemotaxis protein [Stutzerimonas xanthomarina]|uniref:Methyl-accepting chemotaxis protein n=2 Tax=Stutzerimonas xanthomarina TaxID=271420 RepID=A0A1M5NYH7_9GAMM|nr:methyl-accepting chemotaxis protein [Stutzerimonas xanthomarina]MCP9338680.1 methyl-accepting chemotaxis protein [Stutzerimonas xanthomarina]SEH79523.1 methyl-accepting chemotaxis protein [Stutzerimonas xanthomarina]SHG94616.1 methyl-accepting chemotaxis protein [Stutzerimonas xanthomarina DSM 18231]